MQKAELYCLKFWLPNNPQKDATLHSRSIHNGLGIEVNNRTHLLPYIRNYADVCGYIYTVHINHTQSEATSTAGLYMGSVIQNAGTYITILTLFSICW